MTVLHGNAIGLVTLAVAVNAAGGTTPTEQAVRAQYVALLEGFAGWAEQHWNESDQAFNAAGRGVSWARGNGNVCVGYAVLLTERPEQAHFSKHRIPRKRLLDHVRRALRTLCLTNRNCTHRDRATKPRWGGPSWQSGLETSGWAWAAHLLAGQLDDETLALVRQVATAEADQIKKQIPSRVRNDTGSEDCIWNTALAGVAANFYADDARAASWDEWAKRWALNAFSRKPDRTSDQLVDGRPLAQWLVSVNLHPDRTLENHGFWSVPYQADFAGFAEAELAYRVCGKAVPAAYRLHAQPLWDDVLAWLVLPDGDLLCPQGQDWAERDIQHLWCYAWLATCHGINAARIPEQWGLRLLGRRQRAFADGSLHAYDFGYQTHAFKRWAFAALMHRHFARPDAKTSDADRVGKLGTRIFPHVGVGVSRTRSIVSSVSWDDSRQTVLVVPNDADRLGDDPTFTSYHPLSGLGWVQVNGKKRPERNYKITNEPQLAQPDGALTVSFVREVPGLIRQRVGYAALPDGPVIVFSRWESLRDVDLLEVVSHSLFWVRIRRFIPRRKVSQAGREIWDIGGRVRMQVIGGLGAETQAGALLGSARMKPWAAKKGQILDESVCVYQDLTSTTPPATVSGSATRVRLGGWTVAIGRDGAIKVTARTR